MRLLHIADLHLGKNLHGFPLTDDQAHALRGVLKLCKEQKPDAIMIAGDVYDRSVPAASATVQLNDFLTALFDMEIAVFLIAGNHDASERMQFGGRILSRSGLHLSGMYNGKPHIVTLEDEYGPVHFNLLPYLSPAQARSYFPDREIRSHAQAVASALDYELPKGRNVLITHQYVTEGTEGIAGGLDAMGASIFDRFDYVALGHVHRPYSISRPNVRYAGSLLKYDIDDANDKKGALLVELGANGFLGTQFLELAPLRDMRVVTGRFEDIINAAQGDDAYIYAKLTDKEDIPEAMRRLRAVYPNALHIRYERERINTQTEIYKAENKSTIEHFADFFKHINSRELDEFGLEAVAEAIDPAAEEVAY